MKNDPQDLALVRRIFTQPPSEPSAPLAWLPPDIGGWVKQLFGTTSRYEVHGVGGPAPWWFDTVVPISVDACWFFEADLEQLAGRLGRYTREVQVEALETSHTEPCPRFRVHLRFGAHRPPRPAPLPRKTLARGDTARASCRSARCPSCGAAHRAWEVAAPYLAVERAKNVLVLCLACARGPLQLLSWEGAFRVELENAPPGEEAKPTEEELRARVRG
ncbi:MAG: hypothetical protein RL653_75 [Pseudomonadota bacterium]|jgi:hypothetical protein